MKRRTATLSIVNLQGTNHRLLQLTYHGIDVGPLEAGAVLPGHRRQRADVYADNAGVERMRAHAKACGFTHIQLSGFGTWPHKGGKL